MIRSSRNVIAEKADIRVTRDDGTQAIASTRAIKMHINDLVVEAWISVVEGQTYLALASWRTLNVLGSGQVGREVNVAVQTETGDLILDPTNTSRQLCKRSTPCRMSRTSSRRSFSK